MRVRALILGLSALTALAGCANVVDGSGHTVRSPAPAPSPLSAFPSAPSSADATAAPPPTAKPTPAPSSTATPAEQLTCPHIVDPGTHLQYDCITASMHLGNNAVWPHNFYDTVEKKTGWAVSEGAGHWGPRGGHALRAITEHVRQQMVDDNQYGTHPQVSTLGATKATINGAAGFVLESKIRLSPAYRAADNEQVKIEKSWTVAIKVGRDDYSLWYVSIPDLRSDLWSHVHRTIASIHVI